VDSELLIRSSLWADASSTEGKEAEGDTIIVYAKDISVCQSIYLSLTDPAGDFKITPIQSSDNQVINSYRGTRWQRTLYTETDKTTARLFLEAHGLRSEGVADKLDDRVIPIAIVIQSNVFRTVMVYLYNNPASIGACDLRVPGPHRLAHLAFPFKGEGGRIKKLPQEKYRVFPVLSKPDSTYLNVSAIILPLEVISYPSNALASLWDYSFPFLPLNP
jgi:hypothetical protein